ncbi:hypothetical protein KR018_010881 [Drosophila ironensis]|nr:hypothetical protein KR018_010881 [Drosophila ironensis]
MISHNFCVFLLLMNLYAEFVRLSVTPTVVQNHSVMDMSRPKSIEDGNGSLSEDPPDFSLLITGGYRADKRNLVKVVVWLAYKRQKWYFGDNHRASGVIIHKRLVLTAAHVSYVDEYERREPQDITAVAGTPNRLTKTYTTQSIPGLYMIVHPQYRFPAKQHDLAVLVLSRELIMGAAVGIARLTTNPPKNNMWCTVLGWGEVTKYGPKPNGYVCADVELEQSLCKYVPSFNPQGMLCAGHSLFYEVDSCSGDSGSPLFYGDTVIGIVSYGLGCGTHGYGGVYVDLYFYRNWLKLQTFTDFIDRREVYELNRSAFSLLEWSVEYLVYIVVGSFCLIIIM